MPVSLHFARPFRSRNSNTVFYSNTFRPYLTLYLDRSPLCKQLLTILFLRILFCFWDFDDFLSSVGAFCFLIDRVFFKLFPWRLRRSSLVFPALGNAWRTHSPLTGTNLCLSSPGLLVSFFFNLFGFLG